MNSLRVRLFGLVAAVTMLVWAGAAGWTAFSTRAEVERVLDGRLIEAARMVAALDVAPAGIARRIETSPYARQLSCQIWSLDGNLVGQSAGAPDAPLGDNRSGFSERWVGEAHWRVYTHVDPSRGVRVMVGDNLQVRQRLVADLMVGLLLPALVGLVALAMLLWITISGGLRPLDRLAREIETRSPGSLNPMAAERLPTELSPVVAAMNGLLARLDSARQAERDFVANAAHELQTPLAGLKTQAEVARRASEAAMRDHALERITLSVDRTSRLVRQLLELAREQGRAVEQTAPAADLNQVLDEIDRDYALIADLKGAPIHIARSCTGLRIAVSHDALRLAIGNLVENALQHAEQGGGVWLECCLDDAFELRVSDRGPGIPAAERERLVRRFERGAGTQASGSGLGLSIVEAAIEPARGILELRDNAPGGLVAVLRFPLSSVLTDTSQTKAAE